MPQDFRRFSDDSPSGRKPSRVVGRDDSRRGGPVSPFTEDAEEGGSAAAPPRRRPVGERSLAPRRATDPPRSGERERSTEREGTGWVPTSADGWPEPWVQLKYFTQAPAVFPRFIGASSAGVRAGDLVTVFDKEGKPFGAGFFNARARIPLRMVQHGPEPGREEMLEEALDRAVRLRRELLRLDETGNAWRVVHGDGDGLGGLVVDRFADVLSVEVSSLGVWRRLERWLPRLHSALGTRRVVVQVDPEIARIEGIDLRSGPPVDPVAAVRIEEHGLRYAVDFADGHKTGFFCDQRENRRQWARWTSGRRVLDLCCYTGGFALAAKVAGGAAEVIGVDLDEKAIAQARANANFNQARIRWVHADAFDYARQMLANQESFGAVVLDPPKFVNSRDDQDLARRKYNDLNALGVSLVERGGLFVTCSCSGLLSVDDFEHLVIGAAHRHGRRLQILDRTGAAPDHPVMSHCPEGRYLKVLWAVVR